MSCTHRLSHIGLRRAICGCKFTNFSWNFGNFRQETFIKENSRSQHFVCSTPYMLSIEAFYRGLGSIHKSPSAVPDRRITKGDHRCILGKVKKNATQQIIHRIAYSFLDGLFLFLVERYLKYLRLLYGLSIHSHFTAYAENDLSLR